MMTNRRTSVCCQSGCRVLTFARRLPPAVSRLRPATLACGFAAWIVLLLTSSAAAQEGEPPRPPQNVRAADRPWDGGDQLDVMFQLSPDDDPQADENPVIGYQIQIAGEAQGPFRDLTVVAADEYAYEQGEIRYTAEKLNRNEPYYFRVAAVGQGRVFSEYVATSEAAVPVRQWFDGQRLVLAVVTLVLCGSVLTFILLARSGLQLKVRKIAGLEAVDEAVGRATEMGRPCLYVPGIQDMNDIQTLAGITILARVAKTAAEYDAQVEVPTSRSLVMTTARETVQGAYLAAGRPDAYNESLIYYVTDEQFGYVAYLSGAMVRKKPAACFYMGSFFAESLILAETGNSIGAIQVAGTAQPAQLPFFVAACDYTLIGEELFAASAYLSGSPEELGSLKGQDVGKLIAAAGIILGCVLLTLEQLTDWSFGFLMTRLYG